MNVHPRRQKFINSRTRSGRGVALVLVLGFLVLITGLVLAFFSSVTTELNSANSYSSGANTRQLADSAVQTVMGTIRNATSQGSNIGWASQPGMIRTWGDAANKASSAPLSYYKLYSSDNLEVNGTQLTAFDPASDVDAGWNTKTALYSDLNSPVAVNDPANPANTINVFPVIDPTAAATVSGTSTLVDGFSYATTVNGNTLGLAKTPASVSDTAARLPMPVKWMYVLNDGTLTAADSTSTTTATFANAPAYKRPSVSNPIVGRVAYWTDDETCKLNINTASEAVAWEPPAFYTGMDLAMGQYQPTQNEYNRYPGHPFTTSLSPILWSKMGLKTPSDILWPVPTGTYNDKTAHQNPQLASTADTFFSNLLGDSAGSKPLAPRSNKYKASSTSGSQAGTTATDTSNFPPSAVLNVDRLYSSVDEFFLQPVPASGTERTPNRAGLLATDVSKFRFFLTANSRAPEVNLFGQPRISMWPQPAAGKKMAANPYSNSASNRSVLDKLIAFCSTVGSGATNYPFYFQRYDASSPTNDYDNIKRNQELFSYLRNSMAKAVPGISSSSLESRLSAPVCDEISTLSFDYIRSCINLLDSSGLSGTNPGTDAATRYQYSYTTPPAAYSPAAPNIPVTEGLGQVVPFVPALCATAPPVNDNARGMGRFPALRSVSLMFIAQYANQPPVTLDQYGRPLTPPSGSPPTPQLAVNIATISPPLTPSQQAKLTANPPVQLDGTTDKVLTEAQMQAIFKAAEVNPMHPFYRTNAAGTAFDDPYLYAGPYERVQTSTDPAPPTYSGKTHACLTMTPGMDPSRGTLTIKNGNYPGAPAPTLTDNQTKVQPLLLLEFLNPAPGTAPLMPNFVVEVAGINTLNVNALSSLNFPLFPTASVNVPMQASANGVNAYGFNKRDALGSPLGVNWTLLGQGWGSNDKGELTPSPTTFANNPYPLVGTSFVVTSSTILMTGGDITVNIYSAKPSPSGGYAAPTYPASSTKDKLVQSLKVNFPNATFPTPKLNPATYMSSGYYTAGYSAAGTSPGTPNSVNYFPEDAQNTIYNRISWYNAGFFSGKLFPTEVPSNYYLGATYAMSDGSTPAADGKSMAGITPTGGFGPGINTLYKRLQLDTVESIETAYGDVRMNAGLYKVPSSMFLPHNLYGSTVRGAHSLRGAFFGTDSLMAGSYITSWDKNLDASTTNNKQFYFIQSGSFGSADTIPLGTTAASPLSGSPAIRVPVKLRDVFKTGSGRTFSNLPYSSSLADFNYSVFANIWSRGGDFDNGIGMNADGPFINKADEGVTEDLEYLTNPSAAKYAAPYFQDSYSATGANLFSPNRQVSSPLTLGSLPVGLDPSAPDPANAWRTLLFNPNPLGANHPSKSANPPDHALLDLFWMPVVQPYAISEPFSTAGKVNMNYQIVPFTYIKRDSALRGILKSTMLTAVPPDTAGFYKQWNNGNSLTEQGPTTSSALSAKSNNFGFRYPIHLNQTLQQFQTRFDNKDIFHSPTQICDLYLYPAAQPSNNHPEDAANLAAGLNADSAGSTTNIQNWWAQQTLTGANMRKRPYDRIYPRLTTKSNSYTVHFRVQTLKKVRTTDPTQWVEGKDQMVSEYRGSSLIERYIDPNDPTLPDFATNATETVDKYYKFRVVSTKKFAPQ